MGDNGKWFCKECDTLNNSARDTCYSCGTLRKMAPEEWAKDYLKGYIDAQPKAKTTSVQKTVDKEKTPNPLSRFFHTIKKNRQKSVLFISAGVLVLMLLFPPFHVVWKGTDVRLGYSFFTSPPTQHKYAKIDAVMLLVQCLIVAVIGMICWLAFGKGEASESLKEKSFERRKEETGVPPPTEDLEETSVKSASSTQPQSPGASGPQGVGGCLVFFCVCLTIIGPLFSLGQMVLAWEEAVAVFARFPSFKTVMYFESFGIVLILLYGFIVGCKIWGGNPGGKRLAKQYLKIRLFGFIGLEAITLLLMLNLPTQMFGAVAKSIVGVLFREGVFFLLWWLYFKKSRRVKNTYDSNSLGKIVGVNRWTYIILIFPIIGIFLAILIPQFATHKKSPSNLKESSGRYERPLEQRNLSAQELSRQRLATYELEFEKIKAENPHKDPYVLEEGMNAIREDPIAPYNYPTVEDLEKWGRERIRKASQKSSEYKGEGCIEGDCRDAQGTHTWPNGDKYVGNWKDGKRHGQGTYSFYDGREYVGAWKNGEYHGQGTLTLTDGSKYMGNWKDGGLYGQGTATFPDGSKYVGNWSDGEPYGQGAYTSPDGKYTASIDGIVRDTKTGLEWITGPDRDMNWYEAKSWVEGLQLDGWRMPTTDDLETLYVKGSGLRNMIPFLETTGWYIWSGESNDSQTAHTFYFYEGRDYTSHRNYYTSARAFAVRSRNDG